MNVLARLAGQGAGAGAVPDRHEVAAGTACCLLVLIGTYLFSAFGGRQLATRCRSACFAVVLLLALRTRRCPAGGRWSSAPSR